jgi:hypothetical protein
MTRISVLFIALLVLGNPTAIAITDATHAAYTQETIRAISSEGSTQGTGASGKEQANAGFTFVLDQGSHGSSKFHHEEDGKSHGFSFEKWDRHRGLRQLGCACLKWLLVLLHLTIIVVAFMHQLH